MHHLTATWRHHLDAACHQDGNLLCPPAMMDHIFPLLDSLWAFEEIAQSVGTLTGQVRHQIWVPEPTENSLCSYMHTCGPSIAGERNRRTTEASWLLS